MTNTVLNPGLAILDPTTTYEHRYPPSLKPEQTTKPILVFAFRLCHEILLYTSLKTEVGQDAIPCEVFTVKVRNATMMEVARLQTKKPRLDKEMSRQIDNYIDK